MTQHSVEIRDLDLSFGAVEVLKGLNLDIQHVAFSSVTKFDGRRMRHLAPNELAQIAGRAGRHMNDGTFGVTGDVTPLDDGTVQAIENHRFTPLKKLNWRNSDLQFGTAAKCPRHVQLRREGRAAWQDETVQRSDRLIHRIDFCFEPMAEVETPGKADVAEESLRR